MTSQPTDRSLELSRLRWFVCSANPKRMTHSLRNVLDKIKVEYYMALGKTLQQHGQALVEEEESLLGGFFFVRTSLKDALKLKSDYGLDYNYVRDGQKRLLWVPDEQIHDFRIVIDTMADKVNYNADLYAVGDSVVVTRGPLCGVHGTLVGLDDKHLQLVLKVSGILAISVKIAKSNVKKLC